MHARLQWAKPWQPVEWDRPCPRGCPALGSPSQSGHWPLSTLETSPAPIPCPSAHCDICDTCDIGDIGDTRWAWTVGHLEPTSSRSSSRELSCCTSTLGQGRLWPRASEPALTVHFESSQSPTGPRPCCKARVLLCRAGWAWPPAASAAGGLPHTWGHMGMVSSWRNVHLSHSCCSLLCRKVLSDKEVLLSTDVAVTRGRKRSERRLLLLQEELVVAKLR